MIREQRVMKTVRCSGILLVSCLLSTGAAHAGQPPSQEPLPKSNPTYYAAVREAATARQAADCAFAVGNDLEGTKQLRRSEQAMAQAIGTLEAKRERSRTLRKARPEQLGGSENADQESQKEEDLRKALAALKALRGDLLGRYLGEVELAESEIAEAVALHPEHPDYKVALESAVDRAARFRGEKTDAAPVQGTIILKPNEPDAATRAKSLEANQRLAEFSEGKR
jgi:hypothetical protein